MQSRRTQSPIPFLLLLLWGCAGSDPAVKPGFVQQLPPLTQRQEEFRKDRALTSFMTGCAHDAKNEYAEAILEYQDALQYDQNAAVFYAISRDYALIGKPMKAVEAGREAVRLEPNSIPYRENLAVVQFSLSQFAYSQQDLKSGEVWLRASISEYEAITSIDPNYWPAWSNLARLYQPNNPLKSLEIYDRILDRRGDDWETLLASAELYSTLGKFNEAAERFRRMLEIEPSNRPLQRQLAESYSKAGRNDEAIRVLKSMLESDSTDLDITAALAEMHLSRNEHAEALLLFNRLLASGIENPELKLRIGIAMFGQNQRDSTYLPKAKLVFEELAVQNPRDWRVFWYLGAIAGTERKDSLSAFYFSKVVEFDQKNGDAWWFVGTNLFDKGEYTKLIERMTEAKQVLPNDFRVYFLLGLAHTRLEQQDRAIEELEKARTLNPKDINTISTLALAYDGMKQFEKSDRLYEDALLLDSSSALILNNYSYSLADRGLQLDRALRMAQQAITAEPDNSSYLDTIGWIYFRLNRFEEARVMIERAALKEGASSAILEHLGDVYYKLGRKDDAQKQWEKSFTLDPKNTTLKEKIDRGTL